MAKFNILSKRKIYNNFTSNLKTTSILLNSHCHPTKIKFKKVRT